MLLPPPTAVRAETILHLSETATVSVHPDELAASLHAEAIATTAAEAQRKVNASMADALARVRQVPGISASTGAYDVWRSGPNAQERSERWRASQVLELHGNDGATLLSLLGELQQQQLAIGQLAWRLAPETARRARQEATSEALKILRTRADEAAALIGLQFVSFKEVRLDNPRPPIMPRGSMAAPMSASASTPPSAEAEDIAVSATVDADVVLETRSDQH